MGKWVNALPAEALAKAGENALPAEAFFDHRSILRRRWRRLEKMYECMIV